MRTALEKAGVETAAARLAALAYKLLKKSDRSPAKAVDGFAEAVVQNFELLRALLSEQEVKSSAYRYLQDRAAEMAGKPAAGGASQHDLESHESHDRSSEPTQHRASHGRSESQAKDDRPVPDRDRLSQTPIESQQADDRPVAVRAHGRGIPSKLKPATALAYARTSVFARSFGSGVRELGEVTKFDVIQVKRRGMRDSTIADGLLELDWPDDYKAKLHEVASEEQVLAVVARAYKAMNSLGITNVT